MNLVDLGARIAAAAHLDPITRARTIRELAAIAKTVLAAEQDRAIYEACEVQKYEQVAAELGYSYGEVNRRVTEHRRRTGEPSRRGRRSVVP